MEDNEVEQCMNYFSANFHKRIHKEAEKEYRKFLREAEDVDIMKKVIDGYASKNELPTLYFLKKSYIAAQNTQNPKKHDRLPDACDKCYYSGLREVLFMGFAADNCKMAIVNQPLNLPFHYELKIPCNCDRGNHYRKHLAYSYLQDLTDAGHAKIIERCSFQKSYDVAEYLDECRKQKELTPEDYEAKYFLGMIDKEQAQSELEMM